MTTTLVMLGWLGTVVYLLNHALLSFDRIARGTVYYTINAVAAAAVTVSSAQIPSWQAVIVNGFWVLASIAALSGVSFTGGRWVSVRGLLIACGVTLVVGLVLSAGDHYLMASSLGWASTLLFCGAYLLFAVGHLASRTFLMCNTVAAFGLVPVLAMDGNWPVVVLELVWGLLSLIGWVRAQKSQVI